MDNTAKVVEIRKITISKGTKKSCDKTIKHKTKTEKAHPNKTSAITDRELLNAVIENLYNDKHYAALGIFVLGINTGLRISDVSNFRLCDITDDNGQLIDSCAYQETKTGKVKSEYYNEAVKEMFKWLLKNNNIQPYEYLFTPKGNRQAPCWYDINSGFLYRQDNIGVYRYNEDGEKEYIARDSKDLLNKCDVVKIKDHIKTQSVNKHLHEAIDKLNLKGNYASHCMRKINTFFFAEGAGDNLISEEKIRAASRHLNHSDVRTTYEHYFDKDTFEEGVTMGLNLGLEAIHRIIEQERNGD